MKKLLLFAGLSLLPFAAQAQAPAQVNGCQYNSTPPALTDKQTVVFQCDATGALVIAGSAGGSPLSMNLTEIGGNDVDVGPGTGGSATLRTIPDSSVQITLGTPGTPSSPTLTVQGATSMTPILATPAPATSGGLVAATPIEAAASDNHQTVITGAHQLYHYNVTNKSGAIQYLRFYNAASAFNGCSSATNLVWEVEIPMQTSNVGGISEDFSMGIAFSSGISLCYTGGFGQTDTTNATASASVINIGYK